MRILVEPQLSRQRKVTRDSIALTLSWMMERTIECMAAFGYAPYPPLEDAEERRVGLSFNAGPKRSWHDRDRSSDRAVATRKTEQTRGVGWHERLMSAVAGAWSRMRHEWRVRLAISAMQALDDHTLRDIGVPRCQIEFSARHSDSCRWDKRERD
jgi:uncharacterized protein YjiS (DUF1127 family)